MKRLTFIALTVVFSQNLHMPTLRTIINDEW